MKTMHTITVLSLAISSGGCATIMHGTRQDVGISTTPSGATVTVNGQERGKTPLAVDLRRKEKHLLRVEMPGYMPYEAYLTKELSGWVVGNLLFGGLPGLIIDALTGGLHNLKPKDVTVTLSPHTSVTSSEIPRESAPVISRPSPAAPVPNSYTPAAPSAPSRSNHPAVIDATSSRIRIVSQPSAADVLLEGVRLGGTGERGLVVDLPIGESTIRISKQGFEVAERTIRVSAASERSTESVLVVRLSAEK